MFITNKYIPAYIDLVIIVVFVYDVILDAVNLYIRMLNGLQQEMLLVRKEYHEINEATYTY